MKSKAGSFTGLYSNAHAFACSYASTWFPPAGLLACLADYQNPLLLPPNAVHASTLLGLLVRLAE
jgi:hypothetical protein